VQTQPYPQLLPNGNILIVTCAMQHVQHGARVLPGGPIKTMASWHARHDNDGVQLQESFTFQGLWSVVIISIAVSSICDQ
jgi:hypothetical protein